ncbi:reverse transcriptase-like protein, partial [Escherichia coli]|uniref:reverse transcriptase-like protein n=1 Tax=Escherichia coli TaxID=562 RepID=UPI00200F5690
MARKIGVKNLKGHSDSQLVVRQSAGDYRAKDPTLAKYHDLVTKLIQEFHIVHIENVPHRNNTEADILVKMKKSTKVLSQSSIAIMGIATLQRGWKDPIKKYLTTLKLLEDPLEVA